MLSTRVPESTEDQRLQTYIHGLKQHIRDELELHNISTMEEARCKSRIIERKFVHTNFDKDDSKKNPLQSAYTGNPRYTPPQLREGTKPSLEAQRIKEGKCGDKWDPKHICLQKKLYACEAELEVKEPIENNVNSQQDYHTEIKDDTPQISLAIITEISQPQTLKLKGHIKKNNFMVLIEMGNTHYFINVNLAKVVNLFIFLVPNMKVMVVDGKKTKNVGKCHKVKLQMQEYNLESDFFAVPPGGVDMVLGIQWL